MQLLSPPCRRVVAEVGGFSVPVCSWRFQASSVGDERSSSLKPSAGHVQVAKVVVGQSLMVMASVSWLRRLE